MNVESFDEKVDLGVTIWTETCAPLEKLSFRLISGDDIATRTIFKTVHNAVSFAKQPTS